MHTIFGLLSALLPLLGAFPYIRDILRGKTKPHRGSFLIWAVLGAIALFSQFADGATWSLLLPAGDTIAVVLIFALSIKHGSGGLSRNDIVSLIAAAAGLVLWYFTKQPIVALLIVIGIDAIGTLLTLIKTYGDPHSETFSSWLLASLGGLCAIFAVGDFAFNLLLYPMYIFVANGAVNAVILLRRNHVSASATNEPETSPFTKEL